MSDFLCPLVFLVSDRGVSFTYQATVSPAVIFEMTRRGFWKFQPRKR